MSWPAERSSASIMASISKISHRAHGRLTLLEKPAVPAVDAPSFRSRMAESRTERINFTQPAGSNPFLRHFMLFDKALVVADHELACGTLLSFNHGIHL